MANNLEIKSLVRFPKRFNRLAQLVKTRALALCPWMKSDVSVNPEFVIELKKILSEEIDSDIIE